MNTPLKLVLTLIALALLAFCAFGFLATFEPIPLLLQWTFRTIYGALSLAALLGIGALWRRRSTPSR